MKKSYTMPSAEYEAVCTADVITLSVLALSDTAEDWQGMDINDLDWAT